MTKSDSSVRPIPEGARSLTAHIVCAGAARAIDFYVKAFGAVERFRLSDPSGRIAHACVAIGDCELMLVDEFPEHGALGPRSLGGTPITIHHYVEDVDAVVERAAKAGAKVLMPPTEMFWGDRYAQLEDPVGHRWSVATHTRDVDPSELPNAMAAAGGECGAVG